MTILMLESEWKSSYSLIVIEDVVDFEVSYRGRKRTRLRE